MWDILLAIVNTIDSFITAIAALIGLISWINKNRDKIINLCEKILDYLGLLKKISFE